jgi:hypothetical protein
MMLHANEEISRWRAAKKTLRLPRAAADAKARIWLCVCAYPHSDAPLEVRVNGKLAGRLAAPDNGQAGVWAWRSLDIRPGTLRAGANEIIVRCDSTAMNAWMLGIENGCRRVGSALSTDRGRSWRSENMGACGRLRGEYLIRLRLDGRRFAEPRVPPVVYEDPRHPRLRELRDLAPQRIRSIRDRWRQVLALRNFVARAWTYEAFGRNYAPWDPWTVLAWKKNEWGHGQRQPITMCVHYGMVFCSLAAALGHASRGLAITESINGPYGHFMAEVWDRARRKWIAHDPNFDLHYEDAKGEHANGPLSGVELANRFRAGRSAASDIRLGGGFTSQCPRLNGLLQSKLATGQAFTNVAVWRRNNVISDPAAAPPNHGSVIYCETDLVWYSPQRDTPVAEMFPYRADNEYFNAAPRMRGVA